MMVVVTAAPPRVAVTEAGVAVMVYAPPAAAVIVTGMFTTASATPGPVDRIVTVAAPTAAFAAAVSVRTDVFPVPGCGANAAVTPAGRFSAASVALPVKFVRLIVIVVG